MEGVGMLRHVLRFVLLQGADRVPAESRKVCEFDRLISQFLSVVLSEVPLTRRMAVANQGCFLQLGDGDQLNALKRATGARAGVLNPPPDRGEVGRHRAHRSLQGSGTPA